MKLERIYEIKIGSYMIKVALSYNIIGKYVFTISDNGISTKFALR